MDRRSTNEIGYTHFGGDVTAQVNSSHGVRLSGGSTGGIVEAVGDDTNILLAIRGQGTGSVRIGASGQQVDLDAANIVFGTASTTPIVGINRYRVDYTVPAMSSNSAAQDTVTVTGLTTNSILVLTPRLQTNSTVVGVIMEPRCSTADELKLTFVNGSVSSLSGSTQSGYLLQFVF